MSEPRPLPVDTTREVRLPLLVAAVGVVVQVMLTDYGRGAGASVLPVVWGLAGLFLIWLVYRLHQRLAATILRITSAIGLVIYLIASVADPAALVLAAAYLAQLVPLLLPAVRRHLVTPAAG